MPMRQLRETAITAAPDVAADIGLYHRHQLEITYPMVKDEFYNVFLFVNAESALQMVK